MADPKGKQMADRWKRSKIGCVWLCVVGMLCVLGGGDAKAGTTEAQRQLLREMKRGSVIARARAIDRLGRERVWQARPALRKLLAQKGLGMELQVSAILALGRLRDQPSNAILLRMAAGRYHFMTRISAIWSLVKLQNKASLPGLIRILKQSKSRRIREYAVWAISSYQDRESARHLFPMLGYSHDACSAARRVLRKLGLLKEKVSCSNRARLKRRAAQSANKP